MNVLASVRRKEEEESRRRQRFETAIVCTHLINTAFGSKGRARVEVVYRGMEGVEPPSTKSARQMMRYSGSMVSQLQQHAKHLEESARSNGSSR